MQRDGGVSVQGEGRRTFGGDVGHEAASMQGVTVTRSLSFFIGQVLQPSDWQFASLLLLSNPAIPFGAGVADMLVLMLRSLSTSFTQNSLATSAPSCNDFRSRS